MASKRRTKVEMEERKKLARLIALRFRNMLRAELSVYVKPFSDRVPLEKQSVFNHFLKAADVLLEEGRSTKDDVHDFIKAQFIGLKFAKSPPYPSQLYSANARLRYAEFLGKKEKQKDYKVTEEDFFVNEYEAQERTLQRLCKANGLRPREVLDFFPQKFTKAFLRSKKVKT